MSKSVGNVVSPEEIISKYGADTARLFILFAAPPERDLEWSDTAVEGSYRFLNRVFRFVDDNKDKIDINAKCDMSNLTKEDKELRYVLNYTKKKGTDDISVRFNFNTCISGIMELVNALYAYNGTNTGLVGEAVHDLIIMLAPFVPHITEELWQMAGGKGSVHQQSWVTYDESALIKDEIEIVIQINGKIKDKINVASGLDDEAIRQAALDSEKVKALIEGLNVVKVIVVKGKLVNIVVK